MRKGLSIFLSYWGDSCLLCGAWRGVLGRNLKEIREKNVREEERGIPGLQ